MPYINQQIRDDLDYEVERLIDKLLYLRPELRGGALNYIICTLAYRVWGLKDKMRYAAIAEAIGHVNCAALELYRRFAAPYEDKKMEENGDI